MFLNTLSVAQGELTTADDAYTKAILLCEENLENSEASFGTRRCDGEQICWRELHFFVLDHLSILCVFSDLYLLLLNRGSVRLNNGMPKVSPMLQFLPICLT